ncbi:uncharacterized protein LOC121865564 [Homarus americanus]|uniref:Uncharacterized protein n=1 Tax=Homarus americanus TaxID=6706 RepID=A0A8J5K9L5_HOMAM|nr:uncharacterized protein LOC121865564 [Homarus americanus]KAG7169679.1 hypothetical protein Hamer_G013301 [Homarus americanus]
MSAVQPTTTPHHQQDLLQQHMTTLYDHLLQETTTPHHHDLLQQHTKTLHDLFLQQSSPDGRSARDSGYGGGGCGGFEVFAFLAFLVALLDLLLDLNDMNDGGGGMRQLREVHTAPEGSLDCTNKLEAWEGIWAAGVLADGVLQAVTSPPACGHAYLCQAAATAAARGPLPATITRLVGDWLTRWPSLSSSQLGQITLQASSTLSCPPDHLLYNCSADSTLT